jgi:predicted ATPase
MQISAITIENFKGIKDPARIDFKPITLLFGPNSSGKSTIVQTLHYALEVFERNNLDPDRTSIGGKAVDLGGFETLVYNHDVSKSIRLKIELDLQDEDLPQYQRQRRWKFPLSGIAS